MNCGIQQHKNLLYVWNFMLAVWGIISLAVGVMLRIRVSSAMAASITIAPGILIAIGCILFLFSILRFYGFRYNNRLVFISCACLLTSLMVAHIGAGIALLVQNQKGGLIQSNLKLRYTILFNYYWTDQFIGMSVDDLQINNQCCGIENANDFFRLGKVIPGSCCGRLSLDTCPSSVIYSKGCLAELNKLAVWSGSICGGIVLGIAVFELVDIVLTFMLVNAMKKAQRGDYMH